MTLEVCLAFEQRSRVIGSGKMERDLLSGLSLSDGYGNETSKGFLIRRRGGWKVSETFLIDGEELAAELVVRVDGLKLVNLRLNLNPTLLTHSIPFIYYFIPII